MSNEQAYEVISKHIFIASFRYSEDFKPIIILADDIETARMKAKKHFGIDVAVWPPSKLESSDILEV